MATSEQSRTRNRVVEPTETFHKLLLFVSDISPMQQLELRLP